jgi:AhpD family alkylhydroperoxidase
MAHINVPEGVPGIRSLVMFRPETGQYLYKLAQVLLRDESPLTPAERELIATHVSARNQCMFCMSSHAAAARVLYGDKKKYSRPCNTRWRSCSGFSPDEGIVGYCRTRAAKW